MGKRITAQDGKIELIIADGASDIDIGADGGLVGNVNIGQRVGVDNNGNVTVTDSSDTYSWTLEPQASWIELTASNPGASEYGFYFEVGGEVGQYDVAVAAPSQPPVAADGAFDARWNIWSQNNPLSYELANFGFNGSADLEIYNGIRGGNMQLYTYNDAGTFKTITFDPDAEAFRLEDGLSLFIEEQLTANASIATYGQIWVQTGAPNNLVFTDESGTDFVIGGAASGIVTASGSPLDNQVAVWVDGDTIEGDANFTWTGTILAIAGAGAQLLLPLENDALTPTLAFGDGDTGFYEGVDDALRVAILANPRYEFNNSVFGSMAGNGAQMAYATPTSISPGFTFSGDTDTGIGWNGANQLSLIAGAKEMLRLVETGVATTDQIIIAPAGIIGTAATPALAFGDGDSGFYESGDDNIVVSLGTVATWDFNGSFFQGVAGGTPALSAVDSTATVPNILPWKGDTDTGLGQNAADQLSLIAGGVEVMRLVEDTEDYILANTPILISQSSAAVADVADYGQIWVRDDAPNTLMYTDDTGLDFTANNVLEIEYAYSNFVADADPGAGTIRFNSLTIGLITEVYINDSDNTGRSNTMMLDNLAVGDLITFRSATDPADYIIASVNTAPTDNTTYWTIPITLVHTGTIFTDGDLMRLSIDWNGSAGGITGTVANDQIVVGTGASTVDSSANLTYNGTTLTISGAGTQLLLQQEDDSTTPTLGFGTGDTGLYQGSADTLSISTGTVEAKRFQAATVQTTTATQTEIISIAVPTGSAFGYRINIIGIHDTTEDTVFESIFGAVSNTGGTAAIVGSDIVDRTEDAGAATWAVTVGTDTANLTVDVTGEASHNIDWKCSVEILEV